MDIASQLQEDVRHAPHIRSVDACAGHTQKIACRLLGCTRGSIEPQVLSSADRISSRETPVFPESAITPFGCTSWEVRLLGFGSDSRSSGRQELVRRGEDVSAHVTAAAQALLQ